MKTVIIILIIILLGVGGYFIAVNYTSTPADMVLRGEVEEPTDQEAAVVPLTVQGVETHMIGRWQSTDDARSIVAYREDGVIQDMYDGEVLSEGTWELYTDNDARYNPSSVFLRTVVDDTTFEYAVLSAEGDRFTISYLARGNTLSYVRLTEIEESGGGY